MAPPASHLEVSHFVPGDGQLVPVGKGPTARQAGDTPLCGFLRGAGVSEQYVEVTARLLDPNSNSNPHPHPHSHPHPNPIILTLSLILNLTVALALILMLTLTLTL